jgi:signal transduction histidine kinase
LPALVDELVQLVGPACRHRKVDLVLDASAPVRLQADEEQLRHLLLNLVLNAMEAVPPGGQVRIVSRVAEGAVTIAIEDSGPGPPAEVAERLFEPFSTGKSEGIGLGLAVARQIAEAHGGSLDFSSAGGTCFTVRLPLQAAAATAATMPAGKGSTSEPPTVGQVAKTGEPPAEAVHFSGAV